MVDRIIEREFSDMEQYGAAAREYFASLSQDIRLEFTHSLQALITQELPKFQQQAQQSLAATVLSPVAGLLGDVVGAAAQRVLPGALGAVIGAAAEGATRTGIGDFVRTGRIDAGRVFQGATRAGNRTLDKMNLSRAQRGVDALAQLEKSRRNV